MLTLNLIPRYFKREIQLHTAYTLLKKFFILLFIVLFLTSNSLLLAKMLLQQKIQELSEQTRVVTTSAAKVQQKIIAINSLFTQTQGAINNTTSWSTVIQQLEQSKTAQIEISEFTITSTENAASIQLSGISPSREHFLNFQEALKKSPFVKNISSPIQNILSAEETTFSITIEIDRTTIPPAQ